MSIESEIDRLYQLPLSEFTAARNALAKQTGGAEAARVRRLRKPGAVPWAVNQLHWHARSLFDRLMKTGAALRALQVGALKGGRTSADLERASRDHRQALSDAIARATILASEGHVSPDRDVLSRMLEAISLAPRRLDDVGRLIDIVQPAGFEALAGVTPRVGGPHAPAPPSSRTSRPRSEREDRTTSREERRRRIERESRSAKHQDDAAAREAEAAKRRAAREIKALEQSLARARAAQQIARRTLERTDEQVRTILEKIAAARSV